MIVKPKAAQGYNLSWNLNILSGPKWAITCGNCGGTFEKRIPKIDYPRLPCPQCGALNQLDINWSD